MKFFLALSLLVLGNLQGATRLLVTAVDAKTGAAVTDLKADELVATDDKVPRAVESVELTSTPIDVMLLLDSSLAGEMVQRLAVVLIGQLQPKEQMAIISYASSADLIQDFTSSHEILKDALRSVKYGNSPRVLDALYAAIDGGFEHSTYRRVILLLTTGLEGSSRTEDKEVIRLARKNAVSIYPAYVVGNERYLFENLARRTGGASLRVGDRRRGANESAAPHIFEIMRQHYVVTIAGNSEPGEKFKLEAKRSPKVNVSALAIE